MPCLRPAPLKAGQHCRQQIPVHVAAALIEHVGFAEPSDLQHLDEAKLKKVEEAGGIKGDDLAKLRTAVSNAKAGLAAGGALVTATRPVRPPSASMQSKAKAAAAPSAVAATPQEAEAAAAADKTGAATGATAAKAPPAKVEAPSTEVKAANAESPAPAPAPAAPAPTSAGTPAAVPPTPTSTPAASDSPAAGADATGASGKDGNGESSTAPAESQAPAESSPQPGPLDTLLALQQKYSTNGMLGDKAWAELIAAAKAAAAARTQDIANDKAKYDAMLPALKLENVGLAFCCQELGATLPSSALSDFRAVKLRTALNGRTVYVVQHGWVIDGLSAAHEALAAALEGCGAKVHFSGTEEFKAADAHIILMTDQLKEKASKAIKQALDSSQPLCAVRAQAKPELTVSSVLGNEAVEKVKAPVVEWAAYTHGVIDMGGGQKGWVEDWTPQQYLQPVPQALLESVVETICGPEWDGLNRSAADAGAKAPARKVFISYATHEPLAVSRALVLRKRFGDSGLDCFLAGVDEPGPGVDRLLWVSSALDQCSLVVVLATPGYGSKEGSSTFSTYEELVYAKKYNKKLYLVRVSQAVKDPATELLLVPIKDALRGVWENGAFYNEHVPSDILKQVPALLAAGGSTVSTAK